MTSTVEPQASFRLPTLTSLRWWAALLVFLFHLGQPGWLSSPLLVPFRAGQTAVGFFFVLSGVVLTWSWEEGGSTWRYLRRRAARIYPSHLVTTVAVAVLGKIAHSLVQISSGPEKAVLVLTLLQSWTDDSRHAFAYNGVSWSLSCEAFFYLLLPLLLAGMVKQRHPLIAPLLALGASWLVSLWLVHTWHVHGDLVAFVNPLIRLPEFALGVALGLMLRKGWRTGVPPAVAALIAAASFGWATQVESSSLKDFVTVLPFAVLIAASASDDLRGRATGWIRSRPAVYLGEISFAFYLVHQVTLRATVRAFKPLDDESGIELIGISVLALVLSTAFAAALHHAVELPCYRRFARSRVRRAA